jgi:3-oxoacyl-[acyl-carrier-protein] synthase II
MPTGHRVVITGIGIVAPNGIGLSAFWQSLLRNQSGIDFISRFDAKDYPIRVAGEIKAFRLADFVDEPVRQGRLARHTELAIAAAKMAFEDAKLDRQTLAANVPVPVVFGVSNGAVDVIERGKEALLGHGPGRVSPYIVSACQPHAIACAVGKLLAVETRTMTVATACGAGLDAIAHAWDLVRRGKVDLVVPGGADSATNPLTVASFSAAGMVPSPNGEDPHTGSRPFDRDRKSGIMAEGAGVLVLEPLPEALARGAVPYLEILGYGDAVDAPGAEAGSGLRLSMAHCLSNAGTKPTRIDYVCAHGPSDPMIDRVETQMIREVLGEWAYRIPVTSIKGATGNPLSAAGPHELATCALIVRHGLVPPTTNYEHPDPHCDLDYVPRTPRAARVNTALVNLHGLGGGNSSMLVGRVDTT